MNVSFPVVNQGLFIHPVKGVGTIMEEAHLKWEFLEAMHASVFYFHPVQGAVQHMADNTEC